MSGPNLFVQRTASQFQGRQLGQLNVTAAATPTALYTLSDGVMVHIKKVYICKVAGSGSGLFSIYQIEDGGTASVGNALYLSHSVSETKVLDLDAYMNTSGAVLKVQSATAQAITFTAYGEEIQTRAR